MRPSGLSGTAIAAAALVLASSVLQAEQFRTAPVTVDRTGHLTTVGGTVVPYKEVTLTAQIPGQVEKVAGREGDPARAGQVMVAINDDALQASKRAAEAQLIAAEASLRNAHVQYSRELWSPRTGQTTGMGLPSMMDSFMRPFTGQYAGGNDPWVRRYADLYGQAKGVDDARTSILAARANIEQLDAKIRDASLTSPFDGVIVKKMVEEGDTVQPGQPLMQIAYVTYLRIQAEVPVGLVSSLRIGEFVPARVDVGGGVPVQARVAQVFPMADASRHTVTVKFDLPSGLPGGPGMYAEVMLPDPSSLASVLPTVPREALVWRGSLPAVMVMKDGKPTLRVVRVGATLPNGRVTILSGLAGGEEVVLNAQGSEASSPTQQAGSEAVKAQ
ncbi:MAG: efflux RND transporter periplasmic adaptor subunit [Hyphomicrobiaceae bacterium]